MTLLAATSERSRAVSALIARAFQLRDIWLALMQQPVGRIGLIIVVIFILAAALAPWITPHSPYAINMDIRLQPPSFEHWLGTDDRGRDVFSRMLLGSRLSLYIVILSVMITLPLGLAVGCVAGYFGGIVAVVLMRITDIFLALPALILALALAAALGAGIGNAIIAISLASWPMLARLAYAETMKNRNADFILAAQLQGAGPIRMITRYVIPLCMPVVVTRVTLNISNTILSAAALGFLSMGAQPPEPEWGVMLSEGQRYLTTAYWLVAAPGAAMLLVSIGFNLLGDGLRDILDPTSATK
jgi:peptide/nickel transport system permease protein